MCKQVQDVLDQLGVKVTSNTLMVYPGGLSEKLVVPGWVQETNVDLNKLFRSEAGCSFNLAMFECADSELEVSEDMCLSKGSTSLYKALLESSLKYAPVVLGAVVGPPVASEWDNLITHRVTDGSWTITVYKRSPLGTSTTPVEFKSKQWNIELLSRVSPISTAGSTPVAFRSGRNLLVSWGEPEIIVDWAFKLTAKYDDWNVVIKLLREELTVENLIQGKAMPVPNMTLEKGLGSFVRRAKSRRYLSTLELPTRSNSASEYYSLGPDDEVSNGLSKYKVKFVQHDHTGAHPPRVHLEPC